MARGFGALSQLLLVALAAILFGATVPIGNVPINDDWVYALAVKALLETGRYSMPSPSSANAIAQIYWGALFCVPFGFSFIALRLSTAVLGIAGVLATYALMQECGAPRRLSIAAALCLALDPIAIALTPTFMTDIPFTALFTMSLWLQVRFIRRGQAASLAAALLVAILCLAIRQFAIVLFVGFGVIHLLRHRFGARSLALATLPCVAALVLQFGYTHWIIATGRTPMLGVEVGALMPTDAAALARRLVHVIAQLSPCFGILLAPFALGVARRQLVGVPALLAALFAALVTATLVIAGDPLPPPGNIIGPSGIGPFVLKEALHQTQYATSAPLTALWIALTAAGAWTTAMSVYALARLLVDILPQLRSPATRASVAVPALVLTTTAAYIGLVVLMATRYIAYDRYVLPMIPLLCAGLHFCSTRPSAATTRPARWAPAYALLAVYGAFGVLSTHDYLAWQRTRWQAAGYLARLGISPHQIDGGYEFNGWLLYRADYRSHAGKSLWWVDDDEYVLAVNPTAGYSALASFPVDRWLNLGPAAIKVLHRGPETLVGAAGFEPTTLSPPD